MKNLFVRTINLVSAALGAAEATHDLSFDPGEPERYRKDVLAAQVHVLDAGHFALDAAADKIAALVQDFVGPRESLLARQAGKSASKAGYAKE